MYWNSLATDRISTRWKTFAPQISNTVRIEDNRARYGNNTATQPMSLESVFATYAVHSNGKFDTKFEPEIVTDVSSDEVASERMLEAAREAMGRAARRTIEERELTWRGNARRVEAEVRSL